MLLEPGLNCWRLEQASRLAVLVDGEAYFAALRSALLAAERQVLILGWDFDGRIALVKDDPHDGAPVTLLDLLNHVASTRPDLHVHVLLWDFAVLYALEREPFPSVRMRLKSEDRVHVVFDDTIPFGGSHHQKIVVVDDRVAFSGGLDLSDSRWDTREHRPEDPRRRQVSGRPYGPFHDVQMLVEGDAAAALGELARARWHAATGTRLESPATRGDRWPEGVPPELQNTRVAIARTLPPGGPVEEVREVERLYVDAIAAARRVIYLENQYFTSQRLAEALGERLREEDGPEVVLVMPRTCSGWLEEGTMGVLRDRFLRWLGDADRHGRLGAFCPMVDGETVMVHAKVCVVDERLCMVSSSNFTKRSMGVDTECDLAVEAVDGSGAEATFIAGVRDGLLAEHLGLDADTLRDAVRDAGSVLGAIARHEGARRLEPVRPTAPQRPGIESIVETVGDPPSPLDTADLVEEFRDTVQEYASRASGIAGLVALSGVVVALALAWQYTPLADMVSVENTQRWLDGVRPSPWVPLVLLAIYVAAGLVSVPITVMNAAVVIVFGPWFGFAYAMVGSLASAAACYVVGQWLGAGVIRRFSSGMVHRVATAIRDRGFLAVLTVRMVPVAPFTLINLVAGALSVSWRDFLLGTFAGMLPGTAVLAAFGHRVERVLMEPSAGNMFALGLVVLLWIALSFAMHRAVEALSARRQGGAGRRANDAAD